MSVETRKAGDVEIGDMLHFPNSRHPKEVTLTQRDETHITFEGGTDTRWVVPLDREVQVSVDDD